MIAVTVLSGENEFLVLRGQLMQWQPTSRSFDEKLRGFCPDLRRVLFSDHLDAPCRSVKVSAYYRKFRLDR